jgi:hypothetical protein
VNSALWWKPHPSDWDVNFPTGWKHHDMKGLVDKVWDLIPGVSTYWHHDRDCVDDWRRHTFRLETANSTSSKVLTPYQRV